ncbi:MAG: LamG domain-containing protein [Proteobacteria bacterium]|nr:MAG: LamG domain-containing protein [Pseudomonadota bacterium]
MKKIFYDSRRTPYCVMAVIILLLPQILLAGPGSKRMFGAIGGARSSCVELTSSAAPAWPLPVAYWKFNETSGTSFIDSVGGYNGSSTGPLTAGTLARLGKAITSPYTTGGGFRSPTGPSFTTGNAYSFAIWFKMTTNTTNSRILSQGGSNGDETFFMIGAGGTNVSIRFFYNPTGATGYANFSCASGVWCHVVGTYNGVSADVYLNGSLHTHFNVAGTSVKIPSNSGVSIGKSNGNTFEGSVDEVALWSTALNATQVRSIYDAQACESN